MKAIYKWGIGLAVCGGAVAAWYACGDSGAEVVTFRKAKATQGDFVLKVQATGTLEPVELVDVGAQVTGEILEFGTDESGNRIDYGSEVKKGQLLARIDDELVKLAVERAEASVKQAEASVKQAEANVEQARVNKNKADRDLERAKKLGVGDALSQMDYDQYVSAAENADAQLASALAQVDTARAQLENARVQLKSEQRNEKYTRITSPVDGTVVVRQVNVGQTVVSSMNASTLFLVARDLSKMQIWTSVNEADIAKIQPGQAVRYTVDALPNETFTGTVNKIRPNATMSSNVVTYIVEVDIENPDRKLLPYMSANANFIVREVKDCLMMQDAAFDFNPEEKYVDAEAAKQNRPPRDRKHADAPPAGEDEFRPARLWKEGSNGKLVPVMVLRGESDGTRSIIKPMPGQSLDENTEFVVAVSIKSADDDEKGAKGGNSPFGMKRPERRQRGAGGVEAKPGQNTGGGHRGGPPM
ncbi:MAG: efflux RND transporter periplasmic adaptor subunit [Akkermansia sp.]|nr:efflux RND transporter periplasmic adaptor subunit [Akkermansia sp.]